MARPMIRGARATRLFFKPLETAYISSATFSKQASEDDATKSLFVANVEGKRTISPLLLGLFEHFETLCGPKVGFFQPIAGEPFARASASGSPRHVELIHTAFSLAEDPGSMVGVSRRECVDLLANGKEEELLDTIYSRFEAYSRGKRVVLIEGTHSDGPIYTPGNRLELNGKMAANLGAPFLMTLDAKSSSASDILKRLLITKSTIEAQFARVVGAVLNQVQPSERADSLLKELRPLLQKRGLPLQGALPHSTVLGSTRLDEIQSSLKAELHRRHSRVDAGIDKVVIASGSLDQTLADLADSKTERCLVACDASRTDLLLGLSTAHGSTSGPHAAAVLLTGASKMNALVESILEGGESEASPLPLLTTGKSTWEAAQEIASITPDILPSSARKIEESKALFGRYVDLSTLNAALEAGEDQTVTPKKFRRNINRICEQNLQHIVLPEGTEPRVLRAAAEVARKGLARVTLLGNPSEIQAEASRISVNISQCEVVDHKASEKLEAYVEHLVEQRKHKGMTLERAKDLLMDGNYYGTLMAAAGDADGMVSGSTSTTASTIRPALQVLKTKSSLVSSVFFMCLPTKVLVYGDCAVNTDPSPEELAQIGVTSAATAAAFGIQPLVAFLSYSTLGSGSGPDVEKVEKAVSIARELRPDLLIEGPIQYDAAVDPEIARTKVKGESQVAGRATVLIVPNLNVGNIVYKAVQQSTGAIAVGPILQGLTKPVNDLSRGCTVNDIVNTVTCTAVQAAALKAGGSRAAAAA